MTVHLRATRRRLVAAIFVCSAVTEDRTAKSMHIETLHKLYLEIASDRSQCYLEISAFRNSIIFQDQMKILFRS